MTRRPHSYAVALLLALVLTGAGEMAHVCAQPCPYNICGISNNRRDTPATTLYAERAVDSGNGTYTFREVVYIPRHFDTLFLHVYDAYMPIRIRSIRALHAGAEVLRISDWPAEDSVLWRGSDWPDGMVLEDTVGAVADPDFELNGTPDSVYGGLTLVSTFARLLSDQGYPTRATNLDTVFTAQVGDSLEVVVTTKPRPWCKSSVADRPVSRRAVYAAAGAADVAYDIRGRRLGAGAAQNRRMGTVPCVVVGSGGAARVVAAGQQSGR